MNNQSVSQQAYKPTRRKHPFYANGTNTNVQNEHENVYVVSPLPFPCAPDRHCVSSRLEGACAGRQTAQRPSSASWDVEHPSTLPAYPSRNRHPRNALNIRTHSPGNSEEGFPDELQRSTSCEVQHPLESGERTLREASRACSSSQQQRTTAFRLCLHIRHMSSCPQ